MKACSTYMAIAAEGKALGLERGRTEGSCQQLRKLLLRYGKRRFGPPDLAQQALLDAVTDGLGQSVLEQLHDRLEGAANWSALLAGIAPLPPVPLPDFMKHHDPEPGLDNAGIDEAMEVASFTGQKRIVHMRIQSLYQEDIGRTVYTKNVELEQHYRLPTDSVVILLWPGADGPAVTGRYEVPARGKKKAETFRYQVQRVWQRSAEECLAAGLGTLPMAPLSNVTPDRLPEIIRRMDERLQAEAPGVKGANIWVASCFWMGLRYSADMVRGLLGDIWERMQISEFYQGTQAAGYGEGQSEGLVEGPLLATRRLLLRQGERRLGRPPEALRAQINAIAHLETLEKLYERGLTATAWEQLQ